MSQETLTASTSMMDRVEDSVEKGSEDGDNMRTTSEGTISMKRRLYFKIITTFLL